MKFVISTQELNSVINKVQNVVPLKPAIPILSFFLIEANKENNELIFTATDQTVGIRCIIGANILAEGAVVLPAKRLAQLIRELSTNDVEISSNKQETATLLAGTSRFKMNGIGKDLFPALPDLSHANAFTIPQKDLKDLLYRISFAVSREDNRYALTGALMHIANGQLKFIGTDGKRLALAHQQINVPSTLTNQSIIPLRAIEEILKNIGEQGDVTVTLMPDKIALSANQTLIITKLLTGDYPDFQRVIPDQCEIIISLHREELISLLRQVMLFAVDSHHSIRCIFTTGELVLTANSTDFGEGHVSMPVNYQGPRLEIAFNPGFFLDILRHCKCEIVTMGITDPYNPGIITDGEPTLPLNQCSPLFVLMPMRLSEQ